MSTKKTKSAARAATKLVHPLARRCADNAWLMLNAQTKFKNPHQLGVAAQHAGLAAKNTIRNIFYPEARPYGKHDQPTAPTLDSLEAAAKALGVDMHDFLDPNLDQTLRIRAAFASLQQWMHVIDSQHRWLLERDAAQPQPAAGAPTHAVPPHPAKPREQLVR